MYTTEKLLEMLTSKKASVRYEACEWIRISQESSPEIVTALENATHDQDQEVAKRANYALQTDVHHQMAINMGVIEQDTAEINENNQAEEMYMEDAEELGERYPALVLILAIVGWLFTFLGILSCIMMVGATIHETYDVGVFCSMPSLAVGIQLLIFRRWLMTQKGKRVSHGIWGRILLILGLCFILTSLWWLLIAGFSLGGIWLIVIGIVLIIPGIWLLTRKEKMTPTTPGSSDDLQREI